MSRTGRGATGVLLADHIIRPLTAREARERIGVLSDILIECVEAGASVSFMSPLARHKAEAFWRGVSEGVADGERVLLVAEADGETVGTVQLIVGLPENQPHRADVSKMLVRPAARRLGVGAGLMRAVEDAARTAGKSLLVLDTANPEAERLYERSGWIRVGAVPGYALLPDGRPCDTTFFYKQLTPL
jgi:GNAT superfamily N-acetyltransferase